MLHVHDLVDFVSEEAELTGQAAAEYIRDMNIKDANLKIVTDGKVRYTVPQIITRKKDFKIFYRVANIYENCELVLKDSIKEFARLKKKKIVPGQMETINIKKEMIDNISGDTIYIELK